MKRNIRFLSLFFPMLFLASICSATIADSMRTLDKGEVSYIHAARLQADEVYVTKPDSSLSRFRHWNPVAGPNDYSWLGDFGTAHQEMIFKPRRIDGTPMHGADKFELYKFHAEKIKYYITKNHYTDLNYFQGPKKMQSILVTHTQNVSPNLSFGVDFRRSAALTQNERHKTQITNFNIYEWYHTENKRYHALISLTGNKLKTKQDDRIPNVLNNEGFFLEPSSVPINASIAERKINERTLYVGQFFDFGPKVEIKDSAEIDSVVTYKLLPIFQLSHSLKYSVHTNVYKDDDKPLFYYFDSLTNDSIRFRKISNAVSITTKANKSSSQILRKNKYTATLRHEAFNFHQRGSSVPSQNTDSIIDTSLQNLIAETSVDGMFGKSISWGATALFNAAGSNSGDQTYRVYAYLPFTKKNDFVGISTGYQDALPDFKTQLFTSNQIRWNRSFSKTQTMDVSGGLYMNRARLKLTADLYSIKNLVYYGLDAHPHQEADAIGVAVLSLNKDFVLGKFSMQNKISYQSTNSEIVRIPEWIFFHGIQFETKIAKGNGSMCIGADFKWFSTYYANMYLVNTDEFYLQDDFSIGSYPLIDLYYMIKLKRARFFVKGEHLNDGLLGSNSYAAPYSPFYGRSFIVGVSWYFFD